MTQPTVVKAMKEDRILRIKLQSHQVHHTVLTVIQQLCNVKQKHPTKHIIGHIRDGFTSQMTKPTVSKHWRKKGPSIPSGPAHHFTIIQHAVRKNKYKIHKHKHKWIYTQWNEPSVTKPNPENCKNCSSKCAYDCAQLQYTIQHRTVLIVFTVISRQTS